MTDVEWKGDEYAKDLQKRLARNLLAACVHYAGELQDMISEKQERRRYSGEQVSYRGLDPSSPGDPPKILSSQLVRSIAWDVDKEKLEGRVGSGMDYALYLELGTSTMQARPFFNPTLTEQASRLEEILTKE